MPRTARELKPLELQRLTRKLPESRPFNYFPVGGAPGLLLRVAKTGACYWVLRIAIGQKTANTGRKTPRRRDIRSGLLPRSLAQSSPGPRLGQAQPGAGQIKPVEVRKEAGRRYRPARPS